MSVLSTVLDSNINRVVSSIGSTFCTSAFALIVMAPFVAGKKSHGREALEQALYDDRKRVAGIDDDIARMVERDSIMKKISAAWHNFVFRYGLLSLIVQGCKESYQASKAVFNTLLLSLFLVGLGELYIRRTKFFPPKWSSAEFIASILDGE